MSDRIIKLDPRIAGHWALFEDFVRRCVDRGERTRWRISEQWRKEIWRRWIELPELSGFFISPAADAHLFSWAVTDFGSPGIHIFQCEGQSNQVIPLLDEFFQELLPAWVADVERIVHKPVEFIEFDTVDPVLWERIFERRGIDKIRKRALLRIELKEQ